MLVKGQDSLEYHYYRTLTGQVDISLMLVEGQDSLEYHYYRAMTGQVTFP